ncbi:MAG: putative 2-aminoethylphosphonate ABC transporter permease subunit [Rhodospirillaceae bacterium]|nr:putative 2-aminoethylphosphonate ABC transporter permease subunit [Rhodospirillaceae bacterium]MBT5514030.1 putative 2-aminoethylphosphonate ABC transporter permease subunit [Rhodospirillaceae bacterium]MBT6086502.1 putative 2-aminoethylphosphonate ABC transporter permease subunit [Rhodospirillaceae bacterium]MBT6610153.1 putative 2-aminoethylphosphonate ABC transporter permease subunit [Rhodospirillaceae bacterium]MBT7247597.1 putative 2-aminoethylphosphonate ABC transporter permease subuni
MRAVLVGIALYLLITMVFPLYAILSKSFENPDGVFIGLSNYIKFFSTPALFWSIQNSLTVTLITTFIVVPLAFVFAYALTRSCMPFKGLFKGIALIPILMPSLLPAIALVYLFGAQGLIKGALMGQELYGPIGIVMGECIFVFPHVLTILLIAMANADARLYEAAQVLGAGKIKTFFTVTLPGVRYGLVSAFFVGFTLVITDFGVPKVLGGKYNVLATDIYKQVVGRLDFEMGAVVGMVLLVPAVAAFFADRIAQSRQVALLSARAVPYEPKPSRRFDMMMMGFCMLIGALILTVLGTAAFASVAKLWPYNLSFSLNHYDFDLMDGGGWDSYFNTLELAAWVAVIGTMAVFTGAYLVEKSKGFETGRSMMQFLCMIPMAVPGLVLGLAYIFFFNDPDNPLGFIYHTMPILVICTVTHFYTVSHLTAVTALKQMDPEFEAVSSSLKVPFYRTFIRVTVPVCLPAILDISMYLFVNAMTTVSAVVFLYSPDTALASVAMLNMDDAGDTAPAAAMGMLIVGTAAGVRLVHMLLSHGLLRRTQAWRYR